MVAEVEVGGAEIARLHEGEDAVATLELSEVLACLVDIQSFDAVVEPYLAGTESRDPLPFHVDAAHGIAGEDVAHRVATLDGETGEVEVEAGLLELGFRDMMYGDCLGLAIGIGSEIENLGALGAFGQRILLVACDAQHREALDIDIAESAVTVYHIIYRAFVALAEETDELNLLAVGATDKALLLHLGDHHGAILAEDDDVVHLRAVESILRPLILLERIAGKTCLAVDIEFLVGDSHGDGLDILEVADLGPAFATGAIFLKQMTEIGDGVFGEMFQVVLSLLDIHLDGGDVLVGLLDVELGDFAYWLLAEFQHIVAGDFLLEEFAVGVEGTLDGGDLILPGVLVFLQLLVDTLLEENLFERHPMPTIFKFGELYFKFLTQKVFGMERRVAQDVGDGHKDRLLVDDDAGLRREAYLTAGESVEGVDGLVGRDTLRQQNSNLDLGGGAVLNLLDFYLAFLVSLLDAVLQVVGGDCIRQLGDDDGLALIVVVHLGADAKASALSTVVIARHIYHAARREVRINLEGDILKYLYGRLKQFAEVVGQDNRGEGDSDTLGALCQQQWKLDGQRDRFFLATVVRGFPFGSFLVEDHLVGELRQAGLDVTGSSGIVAGENVAPVTLAVDEELFLADVDEGVLDGSIAMGVILHRVTHDVGNFGEAAVVGLLHGMEDAALHRLEAVVDIGDTTV